MKNTPSLPSSAMNLIEVTNLHTGISEKQGGAKCVHHVYTEGIKKERNLLPINKLRLCVSDPAGTVLKSQNVAKRRQS